MIHYPARDIVKVFNLEDLLHGFINTYASAAPYEVHLNILLSEYFDDEQQMAKYYYVVDESAYAGYSDFGKDLLHKFNNYIDMICGDEETLNYIIIER